MQTQPHYRDSANTKAPPNVVHAHLEYSWATDAKEGSLNFLYGFLNSLSKDPEVERNDDIMGFVSEQKMEELSKLLARFYFKQGE